LKGELDKAVNFNAKEPATVGGYGVFQPSNDHRDGMLVFDPDAVHVVSLIGRGWNI